MAVDSFAFLPRSFRAHYQVVADPPRHDVWAVPTRPVAAGKIALLTSAGLFLEGEQEPFDLERERAEPLWGDPTWRELPRDLSGHRVRVAHLHINPRDLEEDPNVALPIDAFAALEAEGVIGMLADRHYSFMGYQAPGAAEWRDRYGPDLAARLAQDHVDALVLAPA
jgi:D-proline reductase (dithiol) PrdB